jgi:geranylgeranylglycerol-phosphate geranylgeranyltransferase
MVRATVRGLVELMRLVNVVAAGVLTATGAFVAGIDGQFFAVGAATGATMLAVAAGNAINDYFDRDIDAINRPGRPIPRGAVSARGALLFSLLLFAGAIVLSLLLPLLALAIATVNLVALVSYTELFKGSPGFGNALVAYLGGSTFLFGGAAVGEIGATIALAFLAGVSTFTREIIKDVEDIAGDREEGLNTLPIAIGSKRSLWLATVALGAAVAVSPLPFVSGLFGIAYLVVVVPADAIMLYACYESFEDPSAGQSHIKYGMFLAAAAFIIGRISVLA